MNKIIITLVLLIILFFLFNLEENIIILSSAIILLFLTSLFNKNTYEKFQSEPCKDITIDGKTIPNVVFNKIMNELNSLK
jgi:hypothetical protein